MSNQGPSLTPCGLGKLDLPLPEGVTEWRFVTVREGDRVTAGKIEPMEKEAKPE